jgi:hypothetical protein
MGVSYMDDNSIPVSTDNMASSQAMNPNNVVELKSADASANDPVIFSCDPIIEAVNRTNAERLMIIRNIMESSQPSGAMNKSASENSPHRIDVDNTEV